ncbi:MAG TPA: DUF3027 domain-containing protein [Streptosporangiaceae bacterium]|nr:DUF3027 domain-containing protein [Streptosporangiaceae bacterium]
MSTVRTRTRTPALDEIGAQAVDVARAAAEEIAGLGQVGAHVGMVADGDRVVTHLFECLDPAYAGWRWAVTVARAARAKTVTVSETSLLPGPDALLAPEWVPWRDRLQPGDLGVGDLLPASHDDERLVPVAVLGGDDVPAWSGGDDVSSWGGDAGLAVGVPVEGPKRVLSAIGRDDTAERWYSTDHGPRAPLARAAPAKCATCGFFVLLSAPLGQLFGACANAYAPDDGRVVSVDHGCGAHSEVVLPTGADLSASPIIDELGYDLVDLPGVSMQETAFEPFDRS